MPAITMDSIKQHSDPFLFGRMDKGEVTAYLCVALICLVWGTTYLVLRVGVMEVPPLLFCGIRKTAAGLLLGGGMLLAGKARLPAGFTYYRNQLVAGFLMLTLGNGLVGWAEMHIPSGLAALICSLMPVWVVAINLLAGQGERVSRLVYAGILSGLCGIMLMFNDSLSGLVSAEYTTGILFTLLATVAWASGSIFVKKVNKGVGHPFLNAGIQMFFGGAIMLLASPIAEEYASLVWSQSSVSALVYLTLLGSVAAFAAYNYAIGKLPVSAVSVYAYVNPLVAVLLGWALLQEPLTLVVWLAFLLTVSGVYMVNRGHVRQARRAKQAIGV